MVESGPGVRASTAERQQAVDALQEHRDQERLDAAEFADRVERANQATSRGELVALFTDLPDPRPWFDTAVMPAIPAVTEEPVVPRDAEGEVVSRPRSTLAKAAYALFPLAGIIAVVLFFVTGWWLWFLVIPPVFYFARQLVKDA